MSQISPSVISGMLVAAISGTIWVWPGPAGGAVVVAAAGRGVVTVPSLTVSVTVRVPGVAYLCDGGDA